MVKIKLSYKKEEDKLRILKQLSSGNKIKKVSTPHKTGELYRIYVEIE